MEWSSERLESELIYEAVSVDCMTKQTTWNTIEKYDTMSGH